MPSCCRAMYPQPSLASRLPHCFPPMPALPNRLLYLGRRRRLYLSRRRRLYIGRRRWLYIGCRRRAWSTSQLPMCPVVKMTASARGFQQLVVHAPSNALCTCPATCFDKRACLPFGVEPCTAVVPRVANIPQHERLERLPLAHACATCLNTCLDTSERTCKPRIVRIGGHKKKMQMSRQTVRCHADLETRIGSTDGHGRWVQACQCTRSHRLNESF